MIGVVPATAGRARLAPSIDVLSLQPGPSASAHTFCARGQAPPVAVNQPRRTARHHAHPLSTFEPTALSAARGTSEELIGPARTHLGCSGAVLVLLFGGIICRDADRTHLQRALDLVSRMRLWRTHAARRPPLAENLTPSPPRRGCRRGVATFTLAQWDSRAASTGTPPDASMASSCSVYARVSSST